MRNTWLHYTIFISIIPGFRHAAQQRRTWCPNRRAGRISYDITDGGAVGGLFWNSFKNITIRKQVASIKDCFRKASRLRRVLVIELYGRRTCPLRSGFYFSDGENPFKRYTNSEVDDDKDEAAFGKCLSKIYCSCNVWIRQWTRKFTYALLAFGDNNCNRLTDHVERRTETYIQSIFAVIIKLTCVTDTYLTYI